MKTIAKALMFASLAAPLLHAQIAAPAAGLMLNYQFWPSQYVQFLGPEVPYSMLELDVNAEGKTPIYNVVLTSKDGEKRVAYSNDDSIVAAAKAQGTEAHKTGIAFEGSDTTNVGSVSTLRLTLADGKPLQWHFVQGSDVSEQGRGLTALPAAPVPVFAYREQGAVAGEGTAVQIGDAVSVAEVWKEISQPPYFIAYRGAYTINAHRLIFGAGQESWKTVTAPKALTVGAQWELTGAGGLHRTLKVEKIDGTQYAISGVDEGRAETRFVMDAVRDGQNWRLERVRFVAGRNGEKHPLTVQFGDGTVDVVVGRKTSLGSGSLATTGETADRTAVLVMQSPAWCKGKGLTEETKVSGDQWTLVSMPKH